jgi:hypothetical protein
VPEFRPIRLDRFASPKSTGDRLGLGLFAQAVGLTATGWLVWSGSVAPRLRHESLESVLIGAFEHALVACLWSGVITIGLQLLVSRWRLPAGALRTTLRTAQTAVWFAPATFLLTRLSATTLAAALVLIVSATRLLYSHWLEIYGSPVPLSHIPVARPGLTGVLPDDLRARELAPAFIVAFSFQVGIAGFAMHAFLPAAGLLCIGTAMLTLMFLTAEIYPRRTPDRLPRSIMGLLLTVILAAGLTVGGLADGSGAGFGFGSHDKVSSQPRPGFLESLRALFRKVTDSDESGGKSYVVTRIKLPQTSGQMLGGHFSGVILTTESKPHAPLTVPPPARASSSLAPASADFSSIPFAGEYWMYRQPDRLPPPGSALRQMNPQALSFFTTDHTPLTMEAHQKLEHPIALRCCQEIRLAISNADHYSGTVALELILIERGERGLRSQSLGKVRVVTNPLKVAWNQPPSPMAEILDFPIPPGAAINEFNEIEVIFHRDKLRIEYSARISIERFILVPRV